MVSALLCISLVFVTGLAASPNAERGTAKGISSQLSPRYADVESIQAQSNDASPGSLEQRSTQELFRQDAYGKRLHRRMFGSIRSHVDRDPTANPAVGDQGGAGGLFPEQAKELAMVRKLQGPGGFAALRNPDSPRRLEAAQQQSIQPRPIITAVDQAPPIHGDPLHHRRSPDHTVSEGNMPSEANMHAYQGQHDYEREMTRQHSGAMTKWFREVPQTGSGYEKTDETVRDKPQKITPGRVQLESYTEYEERKDPVLDHYRTKNVAGLSKKQIRERELSIIAEEQKRTGFHRKNEQHQRQERREKKKEKAEQAKKEREERLATERQREAQLQHGAGSSKQHQSITEGQGASKQATTPDPKGKMKYHPAIHDKDTPGRGRNRASEGLPRTQAQALPRPVVTAEERARREKESQVRQKQEDKARRKAQNKGTCFNCLRPVTTETQSVRDVGGGDTYSARDTNIH